MSIVYSYICDRCGGAFISLKELEVCKYCTSSRGDIELVGVYDDEMEVS